MANSKITQDDIQVMKSLRESGLNNADIAKKMGVTRTTVYFYIGKEATKPKITQDDIQVMKSLRESGLSNSLIAKKMGLSHFTINKYIGCQPTGNRADYGSVVSYVTDDSSIDSLREEAKKPKQKSIHLEESVYRFKGEHFSYRVDTHGAVRCVHDGNYFDIADPKELKGLLNELRDVLDFLLDMPQFSELRRSPL